MNAAVAKHPRTRGVLAWRIANERFGSPCRRVDRDTVSRTYRHRENISETPKRDVHRARRERARENGRSENIFDHFELVCQHFALDEPAHSMDVSIIRNVNFRRRNIIHTL